MNTMQHYKDLAQAFGLSVSGVRYRLRVGKPLGVMKGKHKRHKAQGYGHPKKPCLRCSKEFPPASKYNRICPTCRRLASQSSIYAEVISA